MFPIRGTDKTFTVEDIAAFTGKHPFTVGVTLTLWGEFFGVDNFDVVVVRQFILNKWELLAASEGVPLDVAAQRLSELYSQQSLGFPGWFHVVVKSFDRTTLYRWKRLRSAGDPAFGNPCGTPRKGRNGVAENPEYKSLVESGIERGLSGRRIALEGRETFGDSFPSEATIRRYLKRAKSGD